MIRDCGAPVDTRWINEHPELPRIIHCGAHLARPKRYLRYFGLGLENPHDLPAEVARQTARGDGWVKIVGDWIDRADGADSDLRPLWDGRIQICAPCGMGGFCVTRCKPLMNTAPG